MHQSQRSLHLPRRLILTGRQTDRLAWQLAMIASLIVILAISGLGVYKSLRQSITAQNDEQLATIATLKAGQIEHWLAERRDDAQQITRSSAFSDDVRTWLETGSRDASRKEALLRHLQELAGSRHYRTIGIYSVDDGKKILSIGADHDDPANDRFMVQQAVLTRAPVLDDLHFSTTGQPSDIELGYFAPCIDPNNGKVLVIVYLAADPEKLLFPVVQRQAGSSQSAETLLVRIEGDNLIYLNKLRHRTDTTLQFRMPRSTPGLLAAQAAEGKTGSLQGVDYRNIRSLGYALPVAGTPWLLITKVDEDEVYAHINRMALFSALVTILTLLIGIRWLVENTGNTARIERLSRLYAAISKTNQAIIHSQEPAEVYRAVCNACVDLGGLRLAWVGIADLTQQRIVPVEAAGEAIAYLDDIVISTRPDIPEGGGPISQSFREEHMQQCADFLANPATAPWHARAAECDLRSSVSLPLKQSRNTIGILCVYGSESHFFDVEALGILAEMAGNISFFLDLYDQRVQRQRLAKEMEHYLAEIEDLYQNAPCGYHSLDGNGLIVRMNDTELRWLGYSRDEVLYRLHARDILSASSLRVFNANFDRFKSSGKLNDLQMEMVRKDGSVFPINLTASAVTSPDGQYLYSRTSVFDMTDIRKMETERSAHESRLQQLSRRIIAVQEEERRQLVRELHDSTSPNLATIKLILKTLQPRLETMPSSTPISPLEDVLALLEDTAQNIREICGELRPPLLDYAGLVPALDGYARQFGQRTGIDVHFSADNNMVSFSPEIESSLFRIAQEAMTNCSKHAEASTIEIELRRQDDAISLRIADNGRGFPPKELGQQQSPPGQGLLTMRERAEFIGGTFEIASQPGRGTSITVRLLAAEPPPGLPSAVRPRSGNLDS